MTNVVPFKEKENSLSSTVQLKGEKTTTENLDPKNKSGASSSKVTDLAAFVEERKRKRHLHKGLKENRTSLNKQHNDIRQECIAFIKSSKSLSVTPTTPIHTKPSPEQEENTDQVKKKLQDVRNTFKNLQEKTEDSKGVGGSCPWWNRFPDFVPVILLRRVDKKRGIENPRNGDEVFVDYGHQFSRIGQSPCTAKTTEIKAQLPATDDRDMGQWITKPDKRKVYLTKDGKEHVGKKAYELHLKHRQKQNSEKKPNEEVTHLDSM